MGRTRLLPPVSLRSFPGSWSTVPEPDDLSLPSTPPGALVRGARRAPPHGRIERRRRPSAAGSSTVLLRRARSPSPVRLRLLPARRKHRIASRGLARPGGSRPLAGGCLPDDRLRVPTAGHPSEAGRRCLHAPRPRTVAPRRAGGRRPRTRAGAARRGARARHTPSEAGVGPVSRLVASHASAGIAAALGPGDAGGAWPLAVRSLRPSRPASEIRR